MTNLENFILSSTKIGSIPDLLEFYLNAVIAEGYENAVFARVRDRRLSSVVWSRFPIEYLSEYREYGWDAIDPVVQNIHTARRPFRWADLYARALLSNKQRLFMEQCRELGVHSGVTFPFHCPGNAVDLISLSLRDRKQVDQDGIAVLYGMSAQYWLRLGELSDPPFSSSDAPPLTPRELECLRWCKEGKTNWEIGEIVSSSEKTVEFHLSNAARKLGACNRITAVVVGIRNGLISP